jgi:ornithine cyclodeaminase
MLLLDADNVRRALPMAQAIAAMKSAFAALSAGQAEVPLRCRLDVALHQGTTLCMPAFIAGTEEALAVKVVSVFGRNASLGLPAIAGAVLVLEPHTGRPVALLEGGTLTSIRTGAASGAATDLLSRPDSRVVAVFGAGAQARTQLEAVCAVRSIQTCWVYNRTSSRGEALVAELAGQPGRGGICADLRVAISPQQALADADVVCTATSSPQPVFADADLKPGAHVNAVGSYTPEMQEVPPATVQRALVVVDARAAALVEAGDLLAPIRQGLITAEHIHAELGEIVLGRKAGRTSDGQVTLFKSVGLAVQDAAAASLACRNARAQGLGQEVPW